MTSSFGIRAAALPAWRRLHAALADADRPAPCSANPDVWTEDSDPDVAEAAAQLCNGCPVFALCDAFATANKETAGIWAGRSRLPTRGRPAAESKEMTA